MALFRFGRPVSIRWNGLLIEGVAGTVFEVPDEYSDELQAAMRVEPTFEWLDSDEASTLRARVTVLESTSGSAITLSNNTPLSLGTAAPGTGTGASRADHIHPTTGLSLSSHLHTGTYDPAGTSASGISAHIASADPHSIYLTQTEADAFYAALSHTHTGIAASYTSVVQQYTKNDATAKSKGEVVYISSANGTNPIISYSNASTEATSSKTLGLIVDNVSANGFVYVITEGIISGINTSTATAGQSVWLDTTDGQRTYGSPPAEPAHSVYLGIVTKANASTGEMFVKVQNGYELDELHNVSAASPTAGDIIQWATNGSNYMWRKKSLSDAGISATSHAHSGVYDPAGTATSTVSTHAAVTTSVHGITNTANLVYTSDSRLSDARTPVTHTHAETDVTNLVTDLAGKASSAHTHSYASTTHASTHVAAGSDPLSGISPSQITGTAVITTDSRLSDSRTPTSHTHAETDVTSLVTDLAGKASTSHTHSYASVGATTPSSVTSANSGGASAEAARVDHTHSGVTSITGTTSQVVASASNGAVTLSLPQSIATTSSPTFANITATGYVNSGMASVQYSQGATSTNTTLNATTATYTAVTNHEVSFTPSYIGQKFAVTFNCSSWIGTSTVQYAIYRIDITDSSNTNIATIGYIGTSVGDGISIAYMKATSFNSIWSADSTSSRKLKVYARVQTTASAVLTTAYTNMQVVPLA